MNRLYEKEHIIIDHDEINDIYRLTIFDNHGHYEDEFNISPLQYEDLKECFKENNV